MKLKYLLTSAIFLFCGLVGRAQVYEMVYQGFEVGETEAFTSSPATATNYATDFHMSGSRSVYIQQAANGDVTFQLNDLDFTQNTSLRYISLEFDHICDAAPNGQSPVCNIYYKRVNESDMNWHQLTSMQYDASEGGSANFGHIGTFNRDSYDDWGTHTLTNESWKSERFNINDAITPAIATNERKLQIKFVVSQPPSASVTPGKWRLDNIRVNASAEMMVRPTITMMSYPDLYFYPSSRGARIELRPRTSLAVGINPDSVYLYYRVGNDPTKIRVPMTQISSQTGIYSGLIPFYGYDTMMSFYCVVRDATQNANMVTFPKADDTWIEYACVRGVDQLGVQTEEFTGTTSNFGDFPFTTYADSRSEWVFDSALLASAGYGPGEMTALRFTVGSHTNAVTHNRVQIKMKNVPTNYVVDESIANNYNFTLSYMKPVYDGPLTIQERNANGEQTIQFMDTFFYAGKDLVMQLTYDDEENLGVNTVLKMISAHPQKKSIYVYPLDGDEPFAYNPFVEPLPLTFRATTECKNLRPALVMTQHKNLPLLYDMGFDTVVGQPSYGLITPNSDAPMTPADHSIQVRLKNQGALTVNSIVISYSVDDSINGNYTWNGTLAGGATTNVTIAPNVVLPAGFHTLRVWVEDTLTAQGQRYRDHEPYNDSIFSQFIVCEGPMSGVRHIGGATPDFNTVEEFLFALSRCGINDSLVVKLAPGEYQPFVMPQVDGLTTQHYIVFEPESGVVTFASSDTVASIVNLAAASNIRFRNLKFVRRAAPMTNMVELGVNSVNCHFEGCLFADSVANPAANMRINALLYSGYANGLVVDGCTFVGGKTGVDLRGQASDMLSNNNSVKRSLFENQYEYAVYVSNQNNVVVEKNEMYDVMTNTNYVLMLNECRGASRVMSNKIYTSHGAGAIGLNSVIGTSTTHILVANNMIVCNDDGNANLMRTPLNVITANWTDVVYNSVKMTAPQRNNTATATFGGGTLQNSRFMDNIVVCLDNNNYAFNYMPGSSTTNTVGYNVYYSLGAVLNRKAGASSTDLAAWQLSEPSDSMSISVNPNFLNGSRVDLRTFNRLVKGVGTPIAGVTTDMFDTLRGTVTTCPGAFEFSSLMYDFEPEGLVSPLAESCHMPNPVELKVLLRNSGTSAYSGTGLTLGYKVNNGAPLTVAVTTPIPAEDTVTIPTGVTLQLPSNNVNKTDALYTIQVWTIFSSDPNQTNDTNVFEVISRYPPAKPANGLDSIAYATAATITPVAGVEMWKVSDNTSAPQRPSQLYWYRDTTDAAPFYVGGTLTTDTLRMDTTVYFRQKRNMPIVRITQLEFAHANNTTGLTPSMPYWMNANRKVALQLTNVGDARANLFGDSIQTISPTANINNKIFRFTDSVYIEPGQSLVVQYATGTSANPEKTIHTGSVLSNNITSSSKVAFVYYRGGQIEDAVALNNITETSTQAVRWDNIGRPSYVWTGTGVNVSSTPSTAGVMRTSFFGRNTDWTVATNANPMFLNTIDEDWIRYTDNGCEGYAASYTINMIAPPPADIDLSAPSVPSGVCGLDSEEVSVTVHNYGILPVNSVVLNYTDGIDTVTETYNQPIAANGAVRYTFSTRLNMSFAHDTTLTVKVWADSVSGDIVRTNDTSRVTVEVPFTPAAPVLPASVASHTVSYATADTVSLTPVTGVVPVWYDYDGNAIDTGYTHMSEVLYVGGTRSVGYMVTKPYEGTVGTGASANTANQYPTPYQPKSKHAKQQFIYSASELRAAGFQPGFIDSIAFNFKTLGGNNPASSISFDQYTISMGTTTDTVFASTSSWKSTTPVYSRAPQVINQSSAESWITHPLDTPFYWDGTSSLVVQIVHYIATASSSGARSYFTSKTNTTLYKDGSSALTPSTAEYSGAGTRGNNRPNIRITTTAYGCDGPTAPYTITMTGIPDVDMALLWPNGVDTLEYNSCNDIPIYVNVRNQGNLAATGTKLYYYFDTLAVDSTIVSTTIASGATENVLLFSRHMGPGRHAVRVIVSAPGDSITFNDTVSRSFMVRFCNGSYTIAQEGGDYRSFGEAIDTLNIVGIQGPVQFYVEPGTYTEQVRLNNIPGSSDEHTIAFIGTGDNVLLTAATTQNDNYVMLLDSTSHVTLSNFRIEARPATGNFANALVVSKGDHITIDSLTVRVKGTINNVNASCVVLMGEVSNLTFTNNVIDSGYYSFRHTGTVSNYENFTLTGNTFKNFYSQGVYLRGVNNIVFNKNVVSSGVTIDNRALTGLYLAQTAGTFSVQKNKIYLVDVKKGGKRGIQLENIGCTASNPGMVVNNMISCSGTGTAGLSPAKPSGIWIDSSSAYVNIYYNTIRVYCGDVAAAFSENSYSFFSGPTVSHIQVSNNIFSNFSKGYAYYVSELNTLSISNYNAYYTTSTRPFYWKVVRDSLGALQTANGDDANSVCDEPYFISDRDLHLVMTNFAGLAQYNADIPDDIDDSIRHQIPSPTIGADEMDVSAHDMAVVRIMEPIMPTSLNFNPPNNMPPNIESDSVRVIAQFYNNGLAPESNVTWYAYLEGNETATRSATIPLGNFAPGESKIDTVWIPTFLGMIDTNTVHVVVVCAGDVDTSNNDRTAELYLAPAFNLSATNVSTDHTGCNMENTIVRLTIKNSGYKDFPANTSFMIGFQPEITSPTTITVPTWPGVIQEPASLPSPLLMGQSNIVTFSQTANFYPTSNSVDLKFRITGWVDYDYDITKTNDTTTKNNIDSYYSPAPPVGYDTAFAYGTWGAVRASQENSLPIRWYRDSTATFFFPKANQVAVNTANYNRSTLWNNTPQYFHDSVYYLNCHSSHDCPSHFSEVHVGILPLFANDVAFEEVLAPLGGRVYMENDTVRVRIANYGTRSQTNVPVVYQLMRGNNVIQQVEEICPVTIPAGQTHVYTFDSLLNIPTPTQNQNYTLKVWTDLASDASRRNDTIRYDHTFRSLAESTYKRHKPTAPTFDITRVSFNELDFECPPLGRGLTDLATYASPDYPVVHVTKGLTDSLIVQVTPLDGTAQADRVRIWAYIDFNRDGYFTGSEELVSGDAFYDNTTFSTAITIDPNASYGYMRMRVVVGAYSDFITPSDTISYGVPENKNGHNFDVLLFVDAETPATDIAVTQIVAPRSYLIRDDQPRSVSFRIANKGSVAATNPVFNYRFLAEDASANDSTSMGTVTYNGTLQPGSSAVVTIPPHVFPLGITDLTISHNTPDDANPANNTLEYQYNRFHIVRLILNDDFEGENKWYAPKGYNLYSHNFWERGVPQKASINAAYSDSIAWVTDLHDNIVTGTRGNVSYLYSPIINISQIKADTLSFRLRRKLTNGSSLRIEFCNYENKWVNVNADSLTNWYNNEDDECFDNNTSGSDYDFYWIPTNLISGDFPEMLQFRFVYTTPMKTSATAAFGEGCAVDNFHVGRARRPTDVGVVAIPYPTAPAYGQTIYPKVVVHNYGTDTVRHLDMGYIHYGTFLPKESSLDCLLPPLASDTFEFTAPFIVTADFPDTFQITAFTMLTASDLYRDNDTCTATFLLSPLENDISAHSFIYPLDNVVAGDSLQVTLRIRNFGSSPINTATASYIVNGTQRVDENIDFNELVGHPLAPMAYFNYTFIHKFRMPMGVISLTGIIKSDQNAYIYNDTITKRVEGINSVSDLAAASVIVDTSAHTVVRFALVIENRGARGANGFEVGFYIDGDTSTIHREIYSRDVPLPALQTGYHTFDITLPDRPAKYPNVTGFVHIAGDNDRSNDTTRTLATQYLDVEPLKLIIIENAAPDCQVIAAIRNNGNISLLSGSIYIDATINGQPISDGFQHRIEAGQTIYHVLAPRIHKSPNRSYVGSAELEYVSDANPNNNQTTSIEVRGYWEDVPFVETSSLVLDQNYPNPFNDRTTIPFSLPNDAEVRFFVIDAMGHVVESFSRYFTAGSQTIDLDMSAYSTGIYYYGIEVDGKRCMKKMILR